jgi:arsenical pump membrane protein
VIQLVALATGVAGVVVAPRRIPAWVVATAVAAVAVVAGIVPRSALDDALTNLGPPLAFLVLAVPLAVLLDELGLFATVAALVDAGPRLRLALWVLAGLVTVLFNLSPFLEFDGYYVLSDLVNVNALRPKDFFGVWRKWNLKHV